MVSISFFNKRDEGFLLEQLVLALEQEICRMSLKNHVVPESEEGSKKKQTPHNHGGMSKGHN